MKRISLYIVFFVTLAFSAVAVAKTYDSEPKRSYESIDVVLYRVSWWPYCSKAREFLRETGVSLTEHDVENNLQKREEMKAKSGSGQVPVVDIEGIVIRGFFPEAYRDAIEKKRRE